MSVHRRTIATALPAFVAALCLPGAAVRAQAKYDAGASATEIMIGNIMPYSGPASSYGSIGKIEAAYIKMVNDQGGINGRKITFISYDDGYNPARAVEAARKLAESDQVLAVFNALGTSSNAAIQGYLNSKKMPQLFVGTGATKWTDRQRSPWVIGLTPTYFSEGEVYARYILQTKPDAKIAVLYQNDDFGRDMLDGLKKGLGDRKSAIVAQASYELTDPTIDTQLLQMRAANPDVVCVFGTSKSAAQAIKRMAELDWHPLRIVPYASSSIGAVMKPAGLDNAKGVVSASYVKDAADKAWDADGSTASYKAFLAKYMPDADPSDALLVLGYINVQALVEVLKRSGDDLTRANVMKQAGSLKDLKFDMLLPGITADSVDYSVPIHQLQMMRFDGGRWKLFGDPVSSG